MTKVLIVEVEFLETGEPVTAGAEDAGADTTGEDAGADTTGEDTGAEGLAEAAGDVGAKTGPFVGVGGTPEGLAPGAPPQRPWNGPLPMRVVYFPGFSKV